MEGLIFSCGNPLLDLSIKCEDTSLLEKYNIQTGREYCVRDDTYRELFLTIYNMKFSYIPGGAAQNTIRAAQFMLRDHPFATSYVGSVGYDNYAEMMRIAAESLGVRVHYFRHMDAMTGTCAAIVARGQPDRCLVANLGVGARFEPCYLDDPCVAKLLARARYVYLCAYFLGTSMDSVRALARHCTEHNKVFLLNLSSTRLMGAITEHLVDLLPAIQYVFGNAEEALALAEVAGWTERDPGAIAQRVARFPFSQGERVVIITRGKEDTLCAVGDDPVRKFPVPVLPPERIVDTNGAGDSFVGGFLAALALGKDLAGCVDAGHEIAGIVVQHEGCTFA